MQELYRLLFVFYRIMPDVDDAAYHVYYDQKQSLATGTTLLTFQTRMLCFTKYIVLNEYYNNSLFTLVELFYFYIISRRPKRNYGSMLVEEIYKKSCLSILHIFLVIVDFSQLIYTFYPISKLNSYSSGK